MIIQWSLRPSWFEGIDNSSQQFHAFYTYAKPITILKYSIERLHVVYVPYYKS